MAAQWTTLVAGDSIVSRCFYAFIILFVSVVVGKSPVKWDRQHVELKQGDNLTVMCTISELDFLSVIRVEKRDAEKQTTMVIADNNDVKLPFSKLPRYQVIFDLVDDIGTMSLHYKGIRGEDAGSIACYKPSNDQNPPTARLELKVLVPIQSVRLLAITPDGHEHAVKSDTVTLTETTLNENAGRGGGIACVVAVNGSLTPPTVRIMIDSDDVTRAFVAAEQSRILEDVGSGAAGLGIYYGEKKLTYVTAMPEVAWNGRKLTCVAAQEGFPDEIASATIVVKYIPQIRCQGNEVGADIGEPLNLVCEVKASPASAINWYFGDSNDTISNETTPGIVAISLKALDADRTEATLHISALETAQIGIYRIGAHNTIGSSEERIVVRRDKSGVRQRNSNGDNRPKYSHAQSDSNEVSDSPSSSSARSIAWSAWLCSVLLSPTVLGSSLF